MNPMKDTMKRIYILLLLSVLATSCSRSGRNVTSPYPPGYFENRIATLTNADVAADVANAMAKGDRRFLINVGFGGSIPGVTNWSADMREKYGARILDETGDMVFGPKQEEFKKVADEYARKYNQLLLNEIDKAENRPNTPSEATR